MKSSKDVPSEEVAGALKIRETYENLKPLLPKGHVLCVTKYEKGIPKYLVTRKSEQYFLFEIEEKSLKKISVSESPVGFEKTKKEAKKVEKRNNKKT